MGVYSFYRPNPSALKGARQDVLQVVVDNVAFAESRPLLTVQRPAVDGIDGDVAVTVWDEGTIPGHLLGWCNPSVHKSAQRANPRSQIKATPLPKSGIW